MLLGEVRSSNISMEPPSDVVKERERKSINNADQLTKEELEEIIKGIEEGLSDQQIKEYFSLHDVDKMSQFQRMFRSMKRRK